VPSVHLSPGPRSGWPACRRGVAVIAGLVLVILAAGGSVAADGVSFAISPSRLIFTAEPGQRTAQPVTVYNQSDAQLDLRVAIADYLIDDSPTAASTFAVTDWVETDLSTLSVPPRGQAEIRVIVEVPDGAAPGGYQAGLFIASRPAGAGEVAVSGRLGAAVLIELAPDGRPLRREIEATANELIAAFPDELSLDAFFSPRVRTETQVANLGETFVRAVAVDAYRSWASSEPIEQQTPGTTILRGATARFATSGPTVPWFGPVSVTTEIVYERGAQEYATIVVQAETFVVPWRLFALLMACATLFAIVVRHRHHRSRRRRLLSSPPDGGAS
jgi:hypothetical protein